MMARDLKALREQVEAAAMPKDATAAAAEQMSAEQALKMKQLREELFGAMTEQIKEQKATLSSQREEIRTLQRSYEQLATVAAAERKVFEAQVALDDGKAQDAADMALDSMVEAARALVKTEFLDVPEETGAVVAEFRSRLFDTKKFFDPYAGGKFANYLFAQHDRKGQPQTAEAAHHSIEEAQLFIEAAHSCFHRLQG